MFSWVTTPFSSALKKGGASGLIIGYNNVL
jgi:hypothetical protein